MTRKTKLIALTPMLICDDVQASIGFYSALLELEVVGRMDDVGRSGWASLKRGAVELMLASPDYLPAAPKIDGRFPQSIYYFHVEAIDALHAHARSLGHAPGEIVQRFYDQREFELVDPDGHVLVFGEHHPAG